MPASSNRVAFLDILDRTFRIYRENFLPLVGYIALITIPITIINLLFSRSMTDNLTSFQNTRSTTPTPTLTLVSSLVVIALSLIQIVLTYSVITHIASENYFGRKPTIGEAFRAVRSRMRTLGCGFILFYFVLFILALGAVLVAALCAPAAVGFVVVVYIAIATFTLLAPVLVLEDIGASTAINRAYWLGRSRFWSIIGVILALYVISFVLEVGVGAIIGLLGIPSSLDPLSGRQLVTTIASSILSIILSPLIPIAMTLLYYEVRNRVEGLDLLLATIDKPDPRPSDLASPAAGPFMTGRDVLNIVIIGAVGLGITLIAGGLVMGIIQTVAPGFNLPR